MTPKRLHGYLRDGLCHNSEDGLTECRGVASWLGGRDRGRGMGFYWAGFCDKCKSHGRDAQHITHWKRREEWQGREGEEVIVGKPVAQEQQREQPERSTTGLPAMKFDAGGTAGEPGGLRSARPRTSSAVTFWQQRLHTLETSHD